MHFVDQLDWARHANRVAISANDRAYSYRTLQGAVGRLQETMRQRGVGRGDRVIVALKRSPEAVLGYLAVMGLGAAYIPIDPTLIRARQEHVLRTSGARLTLASEASVAAESIASPPDEVLQIGPDCWSDDAPGVNPAVGVGERDPRDIAYIIYTSGTSGRPKGVMIRHDGLTNFVRAGLSLAGYTSETRYLSVVPMFFDGAVSDIFCTLNAGGALFIDDDVRFPPELVSALARHRISDTLLPPAALKLLVHRYSGLERTDLPHLRTIWYGGDSCPVAVLRAIKACLPQVRFIHGYGPTETTHTACAYVFDAIPGDAGPFMPIGKPLPEVDVVAVNERGGEAAVGETGELYIGGVQVMEGYCADPERTRAVLSTHPVTGAPGVFYRTGDFVVRDDDGNYSFGGRRDDLVKLGGYLVSLTEIEQTLLGVAEVKEAYALGRRNDDGAMVVRAAVVLGATLEKPEATLAAHVRKTLAHYAVPDSIGIVDSLDIPRTPQGKTDRQALTRQLFQEQATTL